MKTPYWYFLVDTGGTFTDCLAYDPDGHLYRSKVLSKSALRGNIEKIQDPYTLQFSANWDISCDIFRNYDLKILQKDHKPLSIDRIDFENQLLHLLQPLSFECDYNAEFEITANEEAPVLAARLITHTPLEQKLPPMEIRLGSTKGTNALLERKGSKFAFITTKGFEDLLKINNQQRPDIFALKIEKISPLYAQVYGLEERLDKNGNIITSLSKNEINTLIEKLKTHGIDNVAIAFLHSYLNSDNEQYLKRELQDAGIRYISCSQEMAPNIKILPRATTANVNAYLSPVINEYLKNVNDKITEGNIKVMSSAGGLVDAGLFYPKDSLLSGPAGGVVGASAIAGQSGFNKILTLDMGGTSTDVARYSGDFDYLFESKIAGINIFSPTLSIETVAAGGGSVCSYDGMKFSVGPESAGANPGPASYGAGGPLSITDVNLLLGRLHPSNFSIPLSTAFARHALEYITQDYPDQQEENLLTGFLNIANEKMAGAIRKISVRQGYDPSEYALLAFGGAGGQHACKVAELLDIKEVLIPYEAGLLSAYGMGEALIERFAEKQILLPVDEPGLDIQGIIDELSEQASMQLKKEGFDESSINIRRISLFMRFNGQDQVLEIPWQKEKDLKTAFKEAYEDLFGHWLENRTIELESLKVVASDKKKTQKTGKHIEKEYEPEKITTTTAFTGDQWKEVAVYEWESVQPGATISGPALLTSKYSTVWIEPGWKLKVNFHYTAVLQHIGINNYGIQQSQPEAIHLELFTNRFRGIAGEMGAILERTSFSVNIKERLDFSCALLDKDGKLVANAPHIPVHLGSLGICTRLVQQKLQLKEGDVAITNHPGFGGSHLPDITLIAPVYNDEGRLIGYVANRAHHAELGGKRPGSMPADAENLAEEGIVISPALLVKNEEVQWSNIEKILQEAPWPSRAPSENMADLKGALASINAGKKALKNLVKESGIETVQKYMNKLQEYAMNSFLKRMKKVIPGDYSAEEYLDDGNKIKVNFTIKDEFINIDFKDTSGEHNGNLNANPAIVNSAVIYVLRLLLEEDIPLNEGIMNRVEISLPAGTIVNPDFDKPVEQCPAVVGGNTETSQRIVDTLLKALEILGCSQGTMNNLLFGNNKFGYYETIGGGTGAGEGFHGSDAVHHHMTNTRITDPEIFELRYPVRLNEFRIRENSGGEGSWQGGNGITRKITFLEDVELTILSQHRKEAPYGIKGGKNGKTGDQYIIRKTGFEEKLDGIDQKNLQSGDAIIIETPGGGGYGKPD